MNIPTIIPTLAKLFISVHLASNPAINWNSMKDNSTTSVGLWPCVTLNWIWLIEQMSCAVVNTYALFTNLHIQRLAQTRPNYLDSWFPDYILVCFFFGCKNHQDIETLLWNKYCSLHLWNISMYYYDIGNKLEFH